MKDTHFNSSLLRIKRLGVTTVATAIAATLPSLPAVGAALEEIVVTARKRDESLQEIADQVTVFSSSVIEDSGIDSLEDVATLTPGMFFSGSFFAGNNVLTLRGSGQSPNQAPPASYTIDGVTLQSSLQYVQPLFDIEQIEVLRGPQGTLYGRNSLGGAINITTKAPADEFEASIKLRAQEGNDISLQGSISGPISENLKYRLTGAWEDRDGVFQSALDGHDVNDREATFGRLKLLYTPSESLTFDWRVAVNNEEFHPHNFQAYLSPGDVSLVQGSNTLFSGFCPFDPVTGFNGGLSLGVADLTDTQQRVWGRFAGVLGSEGGDVCPTDNLPGSGISQQPNMPDTRNDWQSFTQNLTWDITDTVTLTSTTDYTSQEVEGAAWIGYNRGQFAPAQTLDFRDILTQEFRLSGGGDSALQWTVGLFYQDIDRDERTAVGTGFRGAQVATNDLQPGDDTITGNELDPALFTPLGPPIPQNEDSIGVFVNLIYDLTDTLELNVGARYDEVEVANDGVAAPLSSEAEYSDFQPKVSLSWQATDNTLIYATYSEGFRPGTLNPNDSFTPGTNVAEQEELSNYEIGFKSEPADNLIINGALYYLDIENWQFFNFTTGGRLLLFAPEAETTGAELSVQWQATESLNISAGYAYTDTEVVDYGDVIQSVDINYNPVPASDFNGASFLYVPEQSLNISAQQVTEAFDGVDLVSRIDLTHTGEYFFGIDNTDFFGEHQDAFTTANIRVGLEADNWRLTGFVNNVADEDFAVHAWVGRHVNLPNSAITPGLPRIYGVELNYDF